jgi:hypothetical protein
MPAARFRLDSRMVQALDQRAGGGADGVGNVPTGRCLSRGSNGLTCKGPTFALTPMGPADYCRARADRLMTDYSLQARP